MGYQDREYYRDATRGSLWLSGESPACRALIFANIVAFVLQKFLGEGFTDALTANSVQIFDHFQVWRLLTAAFLHASPFHILMNMLFLWFVGREMEAYYNTRDFTAFYFAAAIFSSLVWALTDRFGLMPGQGDMLGASGAVSAVVVLYTLYNPKREVILYFVPVPMWVLMVVYIGTDLLQFLTPHTEPIAYAGHLGGAAFGYLYKVGDLRLSRLEKRFFGRRPKLRIVSAESREPAPAPSRPAKGPTWTPSTVTAIKPGPTVIVPEEQFDERFDQILVKIAREGRGSLSEEENSILDEASRRARSRRSERI